MSEPVVAYIERGVLEAFREGHGKRCALWRAQNKRGTAVKVEIRIVEDE